MKQAIQAAARTLSDHPYLCCLLGFGLPMSYGLVKLAALVQSMQG